MNIGLLLSWDEKWSNLKKNMISLKKKTWWWGKHEKGGPWVVESVECRSPCPALLHPNIHMTRYSWSPDRTSAPARAYASPFLHFCYISFGKNLFLSPLNCLYKHKPECLILIYKDIAWNRYVHMYMCVYIYRCICVYVCDVCIYVYVICDILQSDILGNGEVGTWRLKLSISHIIPNPHST